MEKEITKKERVNKRIEQSLVIMIDEARKKLLHLQEEAQKDFMDFFERYSEEMYKSTYLVQELKKVFADISGKEPAAIRAYLNMYVKMLTVTLTTMSPRLLGGSVTTMSVAYSCRVEADQKLLQEYKRLLKILEAELGK